MSYEKYFFFVPNYSKIIEYYNNKKENLKKNRPKPGEDDDDLSDKRNETFIFF